MFKKGYGDWTQYKQLPQPIGWVDFHYSDYGPREIEYWEAMDRVEAVSLNALKEAYDKQMMFVIFTHGHSTSGPFRMTSRSRVRGLMRSKTATPYIKRSECIQHESVFVAAIRQR